MNKSKSMALLAGVTLTLSLGACKVDDEQFIKGGEKETAAAETKPAKDLLPDDIKKAGVLKLGSPQTNPPFISKDSSSPQPKGLIPDLANEVGKELGVKVEFENIPFPGLIPAAQSGRVDAIWSVMSSTKERLQVMDMVAYVGTSSTFLVQKGNPANIDDFPTLCGKKVGILRGDGSRPKVEDADKQCKKDDQPAINIKVFDDAGAGRTQVQSGGIDAWMGGAVVLNATAKSVDGGDTYEVSDFSFKAAPFSVGVLKDDEETSRAIQQALVNIKESGKYDEILKKYEAQDETLEPDEMTLEK